MFLLWEGLMHVEISDFFEFEVVGFKGCYIRMFSFELWLSPFDCSVSSQATDAPVTREDHHKSTT